MSSKKVLFLLLAVFLISSLSGCANSAGNASYEVPTVAVLPGEMPLDAFLQVINNLLDTDGTNGGILKKDAAESFTVPVPDGGEEVLFIFLVGDLEIGIFTEPEENRVVSAYVRSLLYGDDYTELQMMSYAGAILAVLEPEEYETMLAEVLPESAEETDVQNRAGGDEWIVVYRSAVMNIGPKNGG